MAIIKDITGTITKTGKSAVKKTKDLAGMAKLTAEIEETKGLLKSVYVEIGKKYCETHTSETADEDFTINVATVENLKDQLESLKAERLSLRGLVECPKCKKSVDDGYAFCPFCGEQLPEKVEETEESEEIEEATGEAMDIISNDEADASEEEDEAKFFVDEDEDITE